MTVMMARMRIRVSSRTQHDTQILIPINRILTRAIKVTGNPAAQMAAQTISKWIFNRSTDWR